MSDLQIIAIIIAALIILVIIPGIIFYLVARRVYQVTLVRTDPEKWGRHCSEESNPEQLQMWNQGCAWAESVTGCKTDVEIENEGFHLYGEYFDFGNSRAVIIIPGRTESLMYSYYFCPPYQESGFNILVIDIRSHGLSSGKYDYLGIGENLDVLKWADLLHSRFGNSEIILHGICMGANTAIHALTNSNCPAYINGFVTEGCYASFYECYKQHMIVDHHPVFPVLQIVMHMIKTNTGTDVYKTRPIDFIDRVKVPALFLCGKQDLFSLPEKSIELYNRCGSEVKQLIWFETGSHSHLRIADETRFDLAIKDFIKNNY